MPIKLRNQQKLYIKYPYPVQLRYRHIDLLDNGAQGFLFKMVFRKVRKIRRSVSYINAWSRRAKWSCNGTVPNLKSCHNLSLSYLVMYPVPGTYLPYGGSSIKIRNIVDTLTLYSFPDPDLNPVDLLLIGLLDPDPYYFIKDISEKFKYFRKFYDLLRYHTYRYT